MWMRRKLSALETHWVSVRAGTLVGTLELRLGSHRSVFLIAFLILDLLNPAAEWGAGLHCVSCRGFHQLRPHTITITYPQLHGSLMPARRIYLQGCLADKISHPLLPDSVTSWQRQDIHSPFGGSMTRAFPTLCHGLG